MTEVEHGRLRGRRRLLPILVAIVAATTLAGTFAVAPVSAASDQLRVAVGATYRVDPAKRAVHTTLDISVTNQTADTSTTIYFYNAVGFGVPLEATSLKATSNGSTLHLSTTAHKTYREVTIDYPNLFHGKTRAIRLTFELPGGAPRSDSPIRVGPAHAAFTAWAWGDPGLGDVRIIMPPHFTADVQTIPTDAGAQLVASSVDGHTEYTVTHLADPVGWYSTVEATNPEALTSVAIKAAGEPIVIHAWPEDQEWITRVRTILEDSLPDLESSIGLPWPVTRDLDVTEVSSSELEGYAGFFDSSFDRITISEDLDDLTIVHEASHAWFAGDLFQERWIDEGLADEYASRILAADDPGRAQEGPSPVFPTDAAAFDLETWQPPSRIDSKSAAYEQFGYDASWTVMRAIVADVTVERMRDVFKAASAQTLTYVGAGPAEPFGVVADWRRFLDLVTDVGGSTKAEGLLQTWALTDKQGAELPARHEARTRYFALVKAGGDWLPGVFIRKPMSNWRFADAEAAMAGAEKVISARDALVVATTGLGLAVPGELEPVYESADTADDLTTLETRIADWTTAATAIRTARDDLAKERPPLVALGLYDTDPSAGYDAALTAFAAGDDKAVLTGTAATIAALDGAEAIGRDRATMAGVAVGVVVLLVLLLAVVAIRRRRRRPALVPAMAASAAWEPAPSPVSDVPGGPIPATSAPPAPPAFDTSDVPPPPVGVRRLDDVGEQSAVAPRPPFETGGVPPPPAVVRRLDEPAPAPPGGGSGFAPDDPYATLAATPDLVEGTEAGQPRARGAEPD